MEKTHEEVEQQVRYILTKHIGKENPVSRWKLVEHIFGREAAANRGNNNPFDRQIREVIEKYRVEDLIVSSSNGAGYWLAADQSEVKIIADEYEKRSKNMLDKAGRLRKRGMEKFGAQIRLL
jgi:hypothetical protein